MATRLVYDCDGCLAREITPVELAVVVGRVPDVAGGPSSPDIRGFELCEKCAAWAFGQVVKDLPFDTAARLAESIVARKKLKLSTQQNK